MRCQKCKKDIPDESLFCLNCGKKLVRKVPAHKSRGNGQGSVYPLSNGTYIATKVLGYYVGDDGKKHKRTISKSGFTKKSDAYAALAALDPAVRKKAEKKKVTFSGLYEKWLPTHRAGKDTMNCYKAAYKYFSAVYHLAMEDIDVDDLQDCIDDCPHGKRTRENMRALCGLMYKYGIPRGVIPQNLNLALYLRVDGEAGAGKTGLPEGALDKIKPFIGIVDGADYVYAHCYLGFRPSELLALGVKDYNHGEKAFIGGAKTDAGRDRAVTVSPKIQFIIDRLIAGKSSGPVFCDKGGDALGAKAYRDMFYKVLEAAGIDNPLNEVSGRLVHTYTPHSCRHTFATLMKRVTADSKDKLQLIGHTSEEMLRHYQDVDYSDLRKITDLI